MTLNPFYWIGKLITGSGKYIFTRVLPVLWAKVLTRMMFFRILFVGISFMLLTYVALKQAIAQDNPLLFFKEIGNFLFLIDIHLNESLTDILDAGKLTLMNGLRLLGSFYMYYIILKIFKKFVVGIFIPESARSPWTNIPLALMGVFILQFIYALILSSQGIPIKEGVTFYIPLWENIQLLWTLFFQSDIMANFAKGVLDWAQPVSNSG